MQDLEHHLDCSFILKGESCLKLLDYRTSRNSVRVGVLALLISLLAVVITLIGMGRSH